MTWQPWVRAWQDALYGPDGFYRRASAAQHFATSAQGIPGAGPLLARAVIRLARRHRLEHIVDVGAGRGELLREIAGQDRGLTLTGTDVVGRPDGMPARVSWIDSPGGALLSEDLCGLTDALVVAHEWLDVVPCVIAEHDGRVWRRVEVDERGVERLAGGLDEAQAAWARQYGVQSPRRGDRLEVGSSRDAAFAELCSRVCSGVVVAVDYGYRSREAPRSGSLAGYRDGMPCAPVPDGSCDLTAHVCIDSLGADSAARQRDLLSRLGIPTPDAPLHLAHTDPPAYLQSLADRSAWTALRAPGGLGDFWWVLRTVDDV